MGLASVPWSGRDGFSVSEGCGFSVDNSSPLRFLWFVDLVSIFLPPNLSLGVVCLVSIPWSGGCEFSAYTLVCGLWV